MPAPKPVFHNPPSMSLAEYNQIRNGYNLHQIQSLVGSMGKVEFDSQSPDYRLTLMSWNGADQYSEGLVTFENGLVSAKSEFGLK